MTKKVPPLDLNKLSWHIIEQEGDPKAPLGSEARNRYQEFMKVYNECYVACFPIAEERDVPESFQRNMARNKNPAIQANGPSKEMWLYCKNEKGTIVGAANIDIFAGSPDRRFDGTMQTIYSVIPPEFRHQGLFRKIVEKRNEIAREFLSEANGKPAKQQTFAMFAEQNGPLLMTPNQYIQDTEGAGIDQSGRRELFEAVGFRSCECRYIQPALTPDVPPAKAFEMVAQVVGKGASSEEIPTSVIKHHIERFTAHSFPDDAKLNSPGTQSMMDDLELKRGGSIHLAPPGKFAELKQLINVEVLSKLPEKDKDTPIGDLPQFRQVARNFYGKEGIQSVRDMLPHAAKTARTTRTTNVRGLSIHHDAPATTEHKKAKKHSPQTGKRAAQF